MRRAREAVAEGCTASGGRRRHGMRRARGAVTEGDAANVRGRGEQDTYYKQCQAQEDAESGVKSEDQWAGLAVRQASVCRWLETWSCRLSCNGVS